MNIKEFQKNIGYIFRNQPLIEKAFTHTSYANEHNLESYERLEFLGDAIVDFLIGEYLYRKFPDMNEGKMSRIRATLVCENALSELALKLKINECMLLGHGAEMSGDRKRPSILADMFEAHIAAMYLDAGIDITREYLLSVYGTLIDNAAEENVTDYKTMLQEKLQENGACSIEYRIIDADGPVHNCIFTIDVAVNGKVLGRGIGGSKKEAQQCAAREALKNM